MIFFVPLAKTNSLDKETNSACYEVFVEKSYWILTIDLIFKKSNNFQIASIKKYIL